MFDVQIRPILEYAHEIWYNGKSTEEHEKIHLAFMKNQLHVKRSSCTIALYAEFGRFPLVIQQKVQVLKYWQRLLSLPDEHVLKQCYFSLKEIKELGKRNWCTFVHEITVEAGFEYVWNEKSMDDKMLSVIKETLYKNYMQHCMSNIQDSQSYPKLRSYKNIKVHFKQENYLSEIKDSRYITALAHFRISSHNLRIETGRYTRPKLVISKRICVYCDTNETEDELHFLIKCPHFKDERKALYKTCSNYICEFYNINEDSIFVQLMTSTDRNVILATARYIYTCFNIRMQINV
jgi:hypothetical protein